MELACVMTNTNYIKPIHLNMSVDDSMHNLLASEKSLEEYSLDIVEHFLNKYNQNVRLVAKSLESESQLFTECCRKKSSL